MALCTSTLNVPVPGAFSCEVSQLIRHSAFPNSKESVCVSVCPVQDPIARHITRGAFASALGVGRQPTHTSAANVNNAFNALPYHASCSNRSVTVAPQ